MVDKWIGKVAVVTGSSSGIGAAIFSEFARQGLIVIGLDIQAPKESFESEKTFTYHCNVGNQDEVKETFEKIEDRFGYVNILVNCAGIGRNAKILDDDEESLKKMNQVIDTNFRGLMQCTREAFRLMTKSNDYGLIININSVTGHKTPILDLSLNVYGPTKYALTAFNEAVRLELYRAGNKKVRISSISPGIVDSNFIQASGYETPNGAEKMNFDDFPKLSPEAVSSAALYILSTPYEVNICDVLLRSTGEKE